MLSPVIVFAFPDCALHRCIQAISKYIPKHHTHQLHDDMIRKRKNNMSNFIEEDGLDWPSPQIQAEVHSLARRFRHGPHQLINDYRHSRLSWQSLSHGHKFAHSIIMFLHKV